MVQQEPEIITALPKHVVREFWREMEEGLPAEKAAAGLRQVERAKIMAAQGSSRVDGLGQMAARIDGRLFFRLQQQHGTKVHEWLPEYLKDNPSMCAKGYRPKVNPARHGLTGGWLGGKAS